MTEAIRRAPKLKELLPNRRNRVVVITRLSGMAVVESFKNLLATATFDIASREDTNPKFTPAGEKLSRWVLERADPRTPAALEVYEKLQARLGHESTTGEVSG